MKLIFMGTPDIAAQSLQAILQEGAHEVCAVFTREDKPVGRKQVLTAPPVKQLALEYDIPVFQPKTLKDEALQAQIAAMQADLIVVVAYGRILPPPVLNAARFGAVNLHVSLLPKYRGAAPIQWSVIHGDAQTGVSIMQLDEGLDTGDLLSVKPIEIGENETSGELFERVSTLGAQVLLETLHDIEQGRAKRTPQDHAKATLAPPLTKEMAKFDFDKDARVLHNLIRGMNPWPVAYFEYQGKKIKVKTSRIAGDESAQAACGTVLSVKPLTVACAAGALTLVEVVPEGSRPMQGSEWAAGRRLNTGDVLSET